VHLPSSLKWRAFDILVVILLFAGEGLQFIQVTRTMAPPTISSSAHPLKQKPKRKRIQTQASREEQVRKCQETKKARKLQREAARIENEKRKTVDKQRNFFVPRTTKLVAVVEEGQNIVNGNKTSGEYLLCGECEDDKVDDVVVVDHQTLTDKCPSDIYPNLDYDNDDDENEKNNIDDDDVPEEEEVYGVQQAYVRAIQQRLQEELSSISSTTKP